MIQASDLQKIYLPRCAEVLSHRWPGKVCTAGKPTGRKGSTIPKTAVIGEIEVHALAGVSFEIADGELVAITGPSGSGKSTLMNIVGCLDRPTSGSYLLDGIETSRLTETELARVRNRKVGFVFQQFNLLPRTPAIEQVELPLVYAGVRNRRELAAEALEPVGLGDRLQYRPTQLSGGQQQRVAIARAIVTRPSIILADEPTGALDTRTSVEIMAIFQRLNREQGVTVIFVTHEQDIAHHSRRVILLRDGRIAGDERILDPFDAVALLRDLPVPVAA